jgi:hypothetical protein
MLRLLSKRYVKMSRQQIEKLLRSLYSGTSTPTDPERLIAILQDEIRGKFECGENDMDDWQLSGIGAFQLKWNLLGTIPQIQCLRSGSGAKTACLSSRAKWSGRCCLRGRVEAWRR